MNVRPDLTSILMPILTVKVEDVHKTCHGDEGAGVPYAPQTDIDLGARVTLAKPQQGPLRYALCYSGYRAD